MYYKYTCVYNDINMERKKVLSATTSPPGTLKHRIIPIPTLAPPSNSSSPAGFHFPTHIAQLQRQFYYPAQPPWNKLQVWRYMQYKRNSVTSKQNWAFWLQHWRPKGMTDDQKGWWYPLPRDAKPRPNMANCDRHPEDRRCIDWSRKPTKVFR